MLHEIERRLARHEGLGPFLLRVALGAVFVAHALAKAFVYTLPGTERAFEAMGFPGWTAYPVFAVELVGGIALLVGVRTRVVSLVLAAVMVGAIKPHLGNGFFFSNAGGGWEYVAFLVVALVAQAFVGAGAFAFERRTVEGGRHALTT